MKECRNVGIFYHVRFVFMGVTRRGAKRGVVVNVLFLDLYVAGLNPGGATFSTRNNIE